ASPTGASTCADAVRFVYRGDTDQILDNGDPGTSFTGVWSHSEGPSRYGPTSLYAKSAAGTYTYNFSTITPGTYEVFAWWTTALSRSAQVPYTITHSSGSTTVTQDQLQNSGKWNSLGTFSFVANAMVRIDALADGKSYCADAIRI